MATLLWCQVTHFFINLFFGWFSVFALAISFLIKEPQFLFVQRDRWQEHILYFMTLVQKSTPTCLKLLPKSADVFRGKKLKTTSTHGFCSSALIFYRRALKFFVWIGRWQDQILNFITIVKKFTLTCVKLWLKSADIFRD